MTILAFLEKLNQNSQTVTFADTMATIEANYIFTPTAFQNGDQLNQANENLGSCKLFAFAKLQNLSQTQTLACFGVYYFDDVLNHPHATNHGNIRNFMKTGWAGLHFKSEALILKQQE